MKLKPNKVDVHWGFWQRLRHWLGFCEGIGIKHDGPVYIDCGYCLRDQAWRHK